MFMSNNSTLNKVVNWHVGKHEFEDDNSPNSESLESLNCLVAVLEKLQNDLGEIKITYGFISSKLTRFIQRTSPSGTASALDQHASCEINTKGNPICDRNGAACDFLITGYEEKMDEVALHIIKTYDFDRMYFYGNDRPIHLSVGEDNNGFVQMMKVSENGRRYPGRSAVGSKVEALFYD